MIEDILATFAIARPASIKQINTGLINQTFKITNSDGVYGLQSLHNIFPDAALTDMQIVTDHLHAQGMNVPKLIPTITGDYLTRDANGLRWRLYTWISGQTFEHSPSPAMAKSAGQLVGQLHAELAKLAYIPQGSIPHFHDTPYILERLNSVFNQLDEAAKVLAATVLDEAPAAIIDESILTPQIIHGDLKLTNLLFDGERAIGIIDFDTLLHRPAAIDLGDAYRSWCKSGNEASSASVFDHDIFKAVEAGYYLGLGQTTTHSELHLQATRQISYELTARFLTDLVDDSYFGFDATKYPSRKAHNFARATAQLALAQSI